MEKGVWKGECNNKLKQYILKDNPNSFITKADKGNVMVVMEKGAYIEKVETVLSDTNFYSEIARSPLNLLQKKSKL